MTTLADVKSWNAYALSDQDMAACGTPDSLDSAGATFLASVRDALVEAIESGRIVPGEDRGSDEYAADVISEIANDAPDVYTAVKWAEFVDLAAYHEDPTDLGADASDLDKTASVCLYIIAERLCNALVDALAEADDDDNAEDA